MSEGKSYQSLKAVLLWSFCVFFLVSNSAAGQERTYGRFGEPKILVEFLIAKGGDPILLPVTFNDDNYLFILDTGSTHVVFDTSFKDELGEVKGISTARTPGNDVKVEFFDAPEAFLGPLNIQNCQIVSCMNIEELDLIEDDRISGIIGMNFLRRYVVQIDFDGGILSFLEPMRGENPSWGEGFAIKGYSPLVPQITGTVLDDIEADFLIDTGFMATGSLDRAIFNKVLSRKEMKTSEAFFQTLGGIIHEREARIGNLSVEPFEYEGLIFSECKTSILGLSFLSRHVVTFDFPNRMIYFEQGREFRKDDEIDMSGLYITRYSNKTIVNGVDGDSPAYEAGIRANDVILRVENKSALRYQIWELRQLLMSGHERRITMTIKRDDDVKEVSFLLRRRI